MKVVGAASGCLGLVLGAGLGVALGYYAGYSIAEHFSGNHEKQAYLTLPIIAGTAILAALTLGSTGAGIAFRSKAVLIASSVGWAIMLAMLIKGMIFHHIARPAKLRVENRTDTPFELVFIGGDFRRSKRVGSVAPGEFSDPVTVDLDNPISYHKIEGRAGTDYVRNRDESKDLADGNYTYVVSGTPGNLTYSIKKD